jgi:diguanylate cyclase (GGDEF)-like protein
LPDTSQGAATERAEQIRDGVKSLNLPVTISISVGVAVFPDNGSDSETLLKSADRALYRAKQDGGDRVVWQTQPN